MTDESKPRGPAATALALRTRLQIIGAVVSGLLAVVTLLWRTWIEDLTRASPDGGDGTAEWLAVVALAALSVGLGIRARITVRRLAIQER